MQAPTPQAIHCSAERLAAHPRSAAKAARPESMGPGPQPYRRTRPAGALRAIQSTGVPKKPELPSSVQTTVPAGKLIEGS